MQDQPKIAPPISQLLHDWQTGDEEAFDKLISYVYDDLHRRASSYLRGERRGHTLQTTGLVHEAFLKLVDKREIEWQDRNHFYAVAAQAMRRILVDYARKRNSDKRGKGDNHVPLDERTRGLPSSQLRVDLVALDQALHRLAVFDGRQASIVELKYFGGMTLDETAQILGISAVTVKRDWNIARTWLRAQLQ